MPAYKSTYVHEYKAWCGVLVFCPPTCRHGTCCASWVHEELALHLVCLKLVCAAPQQNVNIHLPSCDQQAIAITGRYDRMTMCEANAQRSMCDDFRESEVRRFNVEVAFDDL